MSSVFASDAAYLGRARSGPRKRVWRWGVVLAAVAALHGAAFVWFEHYRDAFAPETVKPPVQVALLTPEPIARARTHRAVPAHTERAPAQPRKQAPVLHALTASQTARAAHDTASKTDARATATTAASDALASSAEHAATSAQQGDASSASSASSAPSASTLSSTTSAGVRFSVPPSGDLHYNTFYNGVENAPGTIHWASEGDGYEMVVSVPLPFVGTFSYESRGRIDAFGLAPERYIEKRGRRPEDVTTFDRSAGRIAFTRTSTTLALPNGAQDRFSMVMQLASLVRAAPDTYQLGVTRAFYVADDDSGELWPIETIGDETIRTADGFLEARHFMRLPRHAGDRRRIDVWLAPSLGWLPARIVQTEPNGTQFELVWRGPLAPPGAENAVAKARTPNDPSDTAAAEPAAVDAAAPTQMREQP